MVSRDWHRYDISCGVLDGCGLVKLSFFHRRDQGSPSEPGLTLVYPFSGEASVKRFAAKREMSSLKACFKEIRSATLYPLRSLSDGDGYLGELHDLACWH